MGADATTDRGAPARRALLETAERMYAERGINGVSLRQIGAAAGQLNTGAARYHFGSKVGLINAIFEHRMVPINEDRCRLIDAIERAGDVRSIRPLVEAFVLPLASALGDRDRPTWYVRFAVAAGAVGGAAPTQPADQSWTSGIERLRRLVFAALDELGLDQPELRWQLCLSYVAHALADREALLERAPRRTWTTREAFLAILVDTAVALITAPTSSQPTRPLTDRLPDGAPS